jgi:hypothetical protein
MDKFWPCTIVNFYGHCSTKIKSSPKIKPLHNHIVYLFVHFMYWLHILWCVCVCVCVRARARAHACGWMDAVLKNVDVTPDDGDGDSL